MAFIVSFYESCSEFDELRKIFLQLDKTHDGKLTMEEVKEGLENAMGKVKKKKTMYEAILLDLDKDGNGYIDYSEFLTAAVNKQRLLS